MRGEVEAVELAMERMAELDQKIKELSEVKKKIAAHQDTLVQHISSTILPILNKLCSEERAQAEASKGWSGFFSTLRQTKKEREERRRRAGALEWARLAKEAEYHERTNVLEDTKITAAETHALIVHARRQKTALEMKIED